MNTAKHHSPTFSNHVLGVELQKAEKLIEEFIYSCSHGLRSPLKSMMGLMNLLKYCRDTSGGDRKFYIKLLYESAQRIQDITNQFEQFIDNSKNDQRVELVDLRACVDTLADGFSDRLKENNISISIIINQRCDFYTDKKRLCIILSSLFSNAITFYDPLKVERKIEFFITASNAGCSIVVRDNGIGIPASEVTKIFDLFYRGSEKSNGAGIGLYVVKEVLTKMEGTIVAVSAVNEDTTFSLWVPNLSP